MFSGVPAYPGSSLKRFEYESGWGKAELHQGLAVSAWVRPDVLHHSTEGQQEGGLTGFFQFLTVGFTVSSLPLISMNELGGSFHKLVLERSSNMPSVSCYSASRAFSADLNLSLTCLGKLDSCVSSAFRGALKLLYKYFVYFTLTRVVMVTVCMCLDT